MLQAEFASVIISMRAERNLVSDGQMLAALSETRGIFEGLKDQIAAVIS